MDKDIEKIVKNIEDEVVDPVKIIHSLIDNSDGFLAFGTVSNPSPSPTHHHFGKLSEKDVADNIAGEVFRENKENDGWPFLSLAQVAFDNRAPIIIMSDMTDHTRNIVKDNRVSLLIDGTTGPNRMNSGRVALMGWAFLVHKSKYRDMFLAKHPTAAGYFDFGDFNLYRVEVTHARLNAGFGKAFWLDAKQLNG